MEKLEEALQHLIGYGNPDTAQIYFFGLEEKGNINDIKNDRKKYYLDKYEDMQKQKEKFFWINNDQLYEKLERLREVDKNNSDIQTYEAYGTIYNIIFNNNKKFEFDEFWKNLIREDSKIFIGNIYHIPKPNHNSLTRSELKPFKEKRLPLVINFIDKYIRDYQKKILLIFGNYSRKEEIMNHWGEVYDYKIPGSKRTIHLARNEKYPNLYWTYHPSWGWLTEEHQKRYAEIIKKNRE